MTPYLSSEVDPTACFETVATVFLSMPWTGARGPMTPLFTGVGLWEGNQGEAGISEQRVENGNRLPNNVRWMLLAIAALLTMFQRLDPTPSG